MIRVSETGPGPFTPPDACETLVRFLRGLPAIFRRRDVMHTGLRVGRIAGIDIQLDWSLLIIIFIITFSLAVGLFPQWHPDWSRPLAWTVAFAAALLFFCSVLLHELSHALVGRMHGIEVRRITLFVFGGAAQVEQEPNDWHGELQTAIIGPVVSLLLGGVCILLTGLAISPTAIDPGHLRQTLADLDVLSTLLLWLGQVNIVLGLFNLVPAFPLDGGRVLRALLWAKTRDLRRATRWAASVGQAFAWLLIGVGAAMMLGVEVPVFGTGLAGGLWIALIGWFLNNAALVSYWQLLIRESLQDVPVSRLMDTWFQTVPSDLPVNRLVDDYLLHSDQSHFPVLTDGRLVGMVSLQHLRNLHRDVWHTTIVGGVMTPFDPAFRIGPRDSVQRAMSMLGEGTGGQIAVLENGQVCGLIRREDILKWLSLYENVDVHPAAVPRGSRE
jgi:Zn-dependent protease/predicted transcriptional regulator